MKNPFEMGPVRSKEDDQKGIGEGISRENEEKKFNYDEALHRVFGEKLAQIDAKFNFLKPPDSSGERFRVDCDPKTVNGRVAIMNSAIGTFDSYTWHIPDPKEQEGRKYKMVMLTEGLAEFNSLPMLELQISKDIRSTFHENKKEFIDFFLQSPIADEIVQYCNFNQITIKGKHEYASISDNMPVTKKAFEDLSKEQQAACRIYEDLLRRFYAVNEATALNAPDNPKSICKYSPLNEPYHFSESLKYCMIKMLQKWRGLNDEDRKSWLEYRESKSEEAEIAGYSIVSLSRENQGFFSKRYAY